MSRPRVEIVMPLATQRGGAEQLLRILIAHARPDDTCDWSLVSLEDGPMVQEAAAAGWATSVVPVGRLRRPDDLLRGVARLARRWRTDRPSAVLSWMTKAHLYAAPAAARSRLPAGFYQHAFPRGGIDRLASRLPGVGTLCCSDSVAAAQRRFAPHLATQVVRPCVDTRRFNPARLPLPAEIRRELGLDGAPVIGLFARLQRWKGVFVFVDACARLLTLLPTAQFVVVGGEHALEPGVEAELRRHGEEAGLGRRLHLPGHQSEPERWMHACDLVVHASIEPEPFGMVVLEGLAMGKPVIASDAGGPAEILAGADAGLATLVTAGDAGRLAAAVLEQLAEPRTDLAVRRRELATRFDASVFVASLGEAMGNWLQP